MRAMVSVRGRWLLGLGLTLVASVAILSASGGRSDIASTRVRAPSSPQLRGIPDRIVSSTPSLVAPPRGLEGATVAGHLNFQGRVGRCSATVFHDKRTSAATIVCGGLQRGRIGIWTLGRRGRLRFVGYPLRDRSGAIRTVIPLDRQAPVIVVLASENRDGQPADVLQRGTEA
jgi:hypothetical protein